MKDEEIYMTVKIDAKVLGLKKPIEVNETNKNIKKTLRVQMDSDKLTTIETEGLTDEETYAAFVEARFDSNELMLNYISDILRLTDAQIDRLEDLEEEPTSELFGQILAKMMHLDDVVEDAEDDGTPSN